jgi:hypothetical protein
MIHVVVKRARWKSTAYNFTLIGLRVSVAAGFLWTCQGINACGARQHLCSRHHASFHATLGLHRS